MIDQHSTEQWFRRVKKQFTGVAAAKAGQPIVYVEVGVWGGAASEWVCQNVLTHPDSIAFGIDPYDQSQERKWRNVAAVKEIAKDRLMLAIGERYNWIYESSLTGLTTLKWRLNGRGIDLLYLDGQHDALYVLRDFVSAWDMLNKGCIVIFDDYARSRQFRWPHVREACAAIELAYSGLIKPISVGKQYALEVVSKELPTHHDKIYDLCTFYPNLALPNQNRGT